MGSDYIIQSSLSEIGYNPYMDKPAKSEIILELHVPDFEIVKKFYSKLGFEIVWEREPEEFKGYLVMKMGDRVICFWGGEQLYIQASIFQKFLSRNKTRLCC